MDKDTPLDLIIKAWLKNRCSCFTLMVASTGKDGEEEGGAFFIREESSKKLLMPIFTSELMATRFVQDHPVDNARIVPVTKKRYDMIAKKIGVHGILVEPSYEPLHIAPIFLT